MADKNYSNREIDRMFREITDLLEGQNETLRLIKEQTTKTNGRVSKLERNMLVVFVVILVTTLLKFPELSKIFLMLI